MNAKIFSRNYLELYILIITIVVGLILRDLPYLNYKFLYGVDSLGHFWFSKMILDTGTLLPNNIDISYNGNTGWFTGYAPYFSFHIVESVTATVTGIQLRFLFLNLASFISLFTIIPIYLYLKDDVKNRYQKYSIVILSALWFYFIFYSFIGSYESLGFFLFMLVMYLTKKSKLSKSEKFISFLTLSILPITHGISSFATFLYLIAYFLVTNRRVIAIYAMYMCFIIFLVGNIMDRIDIPYIGLYFLKYKLLLVIPVIFTLMLIRSHISVNKINSNIDKIIKNIRKIFITPLFGMIIIIEVYILFFAIISEYRYLLTSVHYAFGSNLIIEYILFTFPIGVILVNQFFHKLCEFKEQIFYIIFLCFGFFASAIKDSEWHFMIIRTIEFISPFLILFIASYVTNNKKLSILIIVSLLAIVPIIPSYFYSDQIDRPYYPIPQDNIYIVDTITTKLDCTTDDYVLKTLINIYNPTYDSNYICNVSGVKNKIIIYHYNNIIYTSG